MNIYIYPTDLRWFEFLRSRSPIDEVNFWQPGGRRVFSSLQPGDVFLFRLKSPVNMIAGGGIYAHASIFPVNAAWDAFREKNGVSSLDELLMAIAGLRADNSRPEPLLLSNIGCIMLQAPFFLEPAHWIPVPVNYPLNAMQGRRYDAETGAGRDMLDWAIPHLQVATTVDDISMQKHPMYGDPTLVMRRLGQGGFRLVIADAYSRCCAVTGEHTFPVLEAAHIKPVSKEGEHRADNGLLLRSDLHTLFDLGYVTVTPQHEFRVSRQLNAEWHNGKEYYSHDHARIALPRDTACQPSAEFLQWHNDTVFLP